jgi:hypothetical protein
MSRRAHSQNVWSRFLGNPERRTVADKLKHHCIAICHQGDSVQPQMSHDLFHHNRHLRGKDTNDPISFLTTPATAAYYFINHPSSLESEYTHPPSKRSRGNGEPRLSFSDSVSSTSISYNQRFSYILGSAYPSGAAWIPAPNNYNGVCP